MMSIARTSLIACLLLAAGAKAVDAPGPLEAIQQSGVEAGLCLVIADDVELAEELTRGDPFIVHLLSPDLDKVGSLRQSVQSVGLAGRVVVGWLPQGYLPYPDRFLSLVVADLDPLDSRGPTCEEVLRVLGTRGAACLRTLLPTVNVPDPPYLDRKQYWPGDPSPDDVSGYPAVDRQD
jgi:hypothetical protein